MDKLDWFIKKELNIKHYFRYADDFIIVHQDQDYLNKLIELIANFLKIKLNLELHPRKMEIRKYNQGIDFLGYVISPYYITLRTKTKKRMFRKLKQRANEYEIGDIDQETFNQSLQSYLGILSHAHAYKLRQQLEFKVQEWLK